MEKKISKALINKMNRIKTELKDVITELQKKNLVHTQEALDFIDDINMLSVSF